MATRKASSRSSHSGKSSHKKAGSSAKKTYATKSGKRSTTPPSRRWSAKVTTDSTHPSAGLFKKSAKAIADELAKKSVSPEGPGQGMRMLSFYENRAGKNLSAERKRTLEHAKDLLREKEGKAPRKSSVKKSSAKKASKKTAHRTSENKSARKSAKKSSRKKTAKKAS